MSMFSIDFCNVDVKNPAELISEPSNHNRRKPINHDEIEEVPALTKSKKATKRTHRAPMSSQSCSLRLSSNGMTDLTGLSDLILSAVWYPKQLVILDISMNNITDISGIEEITTLRSLHLHGNRIDDVRSLQKLTVIPRLTSLSCHGNPLARQDGHLLWILVHFPQLVRLNFAHITKHDRRDAQDAKKRGALVLKVKQATIVPHMK
eukprot:gnl/Dysnectes_brevis/4766_a6566_858.p1 GENE.gnl/Dysnectes_brevis/4766_a6566_858~~gnl/Dysnectes_brevis/4766_a6566_858.p1  ORF type:complete len:206 (+),score=24.63 gnl/Dysnectes_brevis/4766_a6566_858:75-692(+)